MPQIINCYFIFCCVSHRDFQMPTCQCCKWPILPVQLAATPDIILPVPSTPFLLLFAVGVQKPTAYITEQSAIPWHKEQCHSAMCSTAEQSTMLQYKEQCHSISWHKEQCCNAAEHSTMPQHNATAQKAIPQCLLAQRAILQHSSAQIKYGIMHSAATNATSAMHHDAQCQ